MRSRCALNPAPCGTRKRKLEALLNRHRQLVEMVAAAEPTQIGRRAGKENIRAVIAFLERCKRGRSRPEQRHTMPPGVAGEERTHPRGSGSGSCLASTISRCFRSSAGSTGDRSLRSWEYVPFNRDSDHQGTALHSGGGLTSRNGIIHGSALSLQVIQYKAFYERLKAAGKAHKVAITACMRKLLTFLTP